ncbi:HupE/UreJ family protein [Methylosinus sp. H3A]|uniref:HupE/UreJ family protein n=1 Tax=Methylosinus sp. H3A TaxID=2785786 RepID=UPI0018C2DAD1|nr:HupE/UreJ family protein [Methylosinus sp. H3A]MBG0812461.1 HupE/UreJ family protein [Methylosinus sp. H3A]
MSGQSKSAVAGALFFLLYAKTASAHIIGARLGDFYAGAVHPLTDLKDVILWFALGILAGSLGASNARSVLLLFPFGLLAGLTTGMTMNATSEGALVAAGALVLLGLLLALELRIHGGLLCAIALGLAAARGAANAGAVGPETNRLLFAAGLAVAGYVIIALVMASTLAFRGAGTATQTWRRVAIRVLGSWIAALGLMMGGLTLAS